MYSSIYLFIYIQLYVYLLPKKRIDTVLDGLTILITPKVPHFVYLSINEIGK